MIKKQRHTAKRIFERLCDEHGYSGNLTTVTNLLTGPDPFKGFSKSKKEEKDAILEALFNDPTAQKVRGVTPEPKIRIDAWVPECM